MSSALAATPPETLTQARAELAAGRPYAADALLQEVVDSADTETAVLEEALVLQCAIYAGDVLGAVALMHPLAQVEGEEVGFKQEVGRQLLLARRAFSAAANNYLNGSVMGSELQSVELTLPEIAPEDVDVMMATLHDIEALTRINSEFEHDSAPGHGLLAQINRYSMLLALSDALPGPPSRDVTEIRSRFKQPQRFDHLHYLDWLARVALDMHRLAQEPDGPDLLGLAGRCDERILTLTDDGQDNVYALRARGRAGSH
jgi:hypothetical protein